MQFRRSVQGTIPFVVSKFSSAMYREFTEDQMRAYFTKNDTGKIYALCIAFALCITSILLGFTWLVNMEWFLLAALCCFIVGSTLWLIVRFGIQVPSDTQYDAWIDRKAKNELEKALQEEDLEDLTLKERERLLVVRGYAVPGAKDAKQHLKQDILWKLGKDGVMRYSVNIYTYVLPLEHRIVMMRLTINTVNHRDSGQSISTYFYDSVGALQKVDENEIVEIDEVEHMYRTRSFCLDTNGRNVSVTIRSLPLDHTPDLPEFDFIQPNVEETIRKLNRYIRSIKECGGKGH